MEDLIAAYLEVIADIENDIEQAEMQAERARKLATRTTSSAGGGWHGGKSDKVGEGVVEYLSTEEEKIPVLCGEMLQIRNAMAALINTAADQWERRILNHVLISGKTVSQAAKALDYSRSQAYRIYKRGITDMEEGEEAERVLNLIEAHWDQKMRQNETPKDGKM